MDHHLGHAEAAVGKDLGQLHSRDAFDPQYATKRMPHQKKMAIESIMTVKLKCYKSLKGRFFADGQNNGAQWRKTNPPHPQSALTLF